MEQTNQNHFEANRSWAESNLRYLQERNIPMSELIKVMEHAHISNLPLVEITKEEVPQSQLEPSATPANTQANTEPPKIKTTYQYALDRPFKIGNRTTTLRAALLEYFNFKINQKYPLVEDSDVFDTNQERLLCRQRLLEIITQLLSPETITRLRPVAENNPKQVPTIEQLLARALRIIEAGDTVPEDHLKPGMFSIKKENVNIRKSEPIDPTYYPSMDTPETKKQTKDVVALAATELTDLSDSFDQYLQSVKSEITKRITEIKAEGLTDAEITSSDLWLNSSDNQGNPIVIKAINYDDPTAAEKKLLATATTEYLKVNSQIFKDSQSPLEIKATTIQNLLNQFEPEQSLANLDRVVNFINDNLGQIDVQIKSRLLEYLYFSLLERNLEVMIARQLPQWRENSQTNESQVNRMPSSSPEQRKQAWQALQELPEKTGAFIKNSAGFLLAAGLTGAVSWGNATLFTRWDPSGIIKSSYQMEAVGEQRDTQTQQLDLYLNIDRSNPIAVSTVTNEINTVLNNYLPVQIRNPKTQLGIELVNLGDNTNTRQRIRITGLISKDARSIEYEIAKLINENPNINSPFMPVSVASTGEDTKDFVIPLQGKNEEFETYRQRNYETPLFAGGLIVASAIGLGRALRDELKKGQ